MTDEAHYEVCEFDGECQQAAEIYYKERRFSHQPYDMRGVALCGHHAAVVTRTRPRPAGLVHLEVIDQLEFPF